MEETKSCSACGASMPVDAVFCPGCGQKQENLPIEEIKTDSNTNAAPAAQPNPYAQPNPQPNPYAQPVQPAAAPAPKPAPAPAPASVVQPNPYQQNPTYSQQQPYYQAQPAPTAIPQKPKKKFPWVFAIAWVALLAFIGVWTVFMLNPDYEVPEISIDTVRILIYVLSVFTLIYTLNIKLATRKLRALPTIFLVIMLVVCVVLFCAYELLEGEFFHDLVSPVTDSFLPTFD